MDVCPRDGTPLFATAAEEADGEFNEELNQSNEVVTSVGAQEETTPRAEAVSGQAQDPIEDQTELIEKPDQEELNRAIRASSAPEPLAAAQRDEEEAPEPIEMAQEPHEDESEELLLDEVVEENEPAPEPQEVAEADDEMDFAEELPAFGAPSSGESEPSFEEPEPSFEEPEPSFEEPEPSFEEPEPSFEEPEPSFEEPEPDLEEESDEVLDLEDLKSLTVEGGESKAAEEEVRGTQHGIPVSMADDEPGFVPTPAQGTRPDSVEEAPAFNDFDDGGFVVPESAPSIDTPPLQEHSSPELEPAVPAAPRQPAAEIPGLEASVEPISEVAETSPEDTPSTKSSGTLLVVGLILLILAIAAGVAVAFSMGMIQL